MTETYEYIQAVKRKYQEVREEEAYDINENLLLPSMKAIYGRGENDFVIVYFFIPLEIKFDTLNGSGIFA